MKVKIDAAEKRRQNLKKISGSKWDHSDDFILRVWELYAEGKLTARRLQQIFVGRTFKAIEDKVYRIRGRGEKSKGDPNQTSLPLGGQVETRSKY